MIDAYFDDIFQNQKQLKSCSQPQVLQLVDTLVEAYKWGTQPLATMLAPTSV